MRPTDLESQPALHSPEGELLSLAISVEPRLLEDLLETLSGLTFPVNPQLYHQQSKVIVEFPAYSARIEEVRHSLQARGLSSTHLELAPYSTKTVPG
jgi:hypothetical protein